MRGNSIRDGSLDAGKNTAKWMEESHDRMRSMCIEIENTLSHGMMRSLCKADYEVRQFLKRELTVGTKRAMENAPLENAAS